ncbi:MAG: diaminopimelate epimerase [Bacteroidales bacterium]|nr:diaminopimelate epimerase [Bacteroidales bacterium]
MIVHFSKYHGTGNDFVMIDGRSQDTSYFDPDLIRQICDRRFGIGSDGLIILQEEEQCDFRMRYFNADGFEGTMCGNGGRCITAYARHLGIIRFDATFKGIDGKHSSTILPNGEIHLKLQDVNGIRWVEDGYLLDTGSPHFVKFVSQLDQIEVDVEGKEIRNQSRFGKGGVNVNFVEIGSSSNRISVRTYERGVEAETLSCGTGVTAAAICSYFHFKSDIFSYHIHTMGGNLNVSFKAQHHSHYSEIYLTGPASHVYDGSIEINR